MPLRKSDRCDACGSQAFVLAIKHDFDLLFCGHHGRKHLDALVMSGWEIVDETSGINPNPSVSASAG